MGDYVSVHLEAGSTKRTGNEFILLSKDSQPTGGTSETAAAVDLVTDGTDHVDGKYDF